MKNKNQNSTAGLVYLAVALMWASIIAVQVVYGLEAAIIMIISFIVATVVVSTLDTIVFNSRKVFNTLKSFFYNCFSSAYSFSKSIFNVLSFAYMGEQYQKVFIGGVAFSAALFYASITFFSAFEKVDGVAEASNVGMASASFFVLYAIYKTLSYVVKSSIKNISEKKGAVKEKAISFVKGTLYLIGFTLKVTIPIAYVTILCGILHFEGMAGAYAIAILIAGALALYIVTSSLIGIYKSRFIIAQAIKHEMESLLYTYDVKVNLHFTYTRKDRKSNYSNEELIAQEKQLVQFGEYAGLTVKGISSKNIYNTLIEREDSINDSYSIIKAS
ncbi:MAG TPA: hypothetical protein DCL21_02950 [Alphaproteobacteria bacterium]|nr:hypothetical protein [Alphaproteobacteria bacterium]